MTSNPKSKSDGKKDPEAKEAAPNSAQAPEAQKAPDSTDGEKAALVVNAQYTKDLSFEAPTAPGIFSMLQQNPPELKINVNVNAQPMQDKVFEVELHIKAECKSGETVAFIMELIYGGLFTINVPEENLRPVLLIECPRLMFPFARNILADCSRDGGFPPLMLGPVDFVRMYQDQLKKEAEGGDGAVN
jgi:preprotein translocase subunit SecB